MRRENAAADIGKRGQVRHVRKVPIILGTFARQKHDVVRLEIGQISRQLRTRGRAARTSIDAVLHVILDAGTIPGSLDFIGINARF